MKADNLKPQDMDWEGESECINDLCTHSEGEPEPEPTTDIPLPPSLDENNSIGQLLKETVGAEQFKQMRLDWKKNATIRGSESGKKSNFRI